MFGIQEYKHSLGARSDVKFDVNPLQMTAHRQRADRQLVGDFLVAKTFGQQSKDFQFPLGYRPGDAGGVAFLLEVFHNFTGDGAGHGSAALMDLGDRFKNFGRGSRFDEITAGPRHKGFENFIGIFADSEDENLQGGSLRLEPGHAANAGHVGKMNIHQKDVGPMAAKLLEGSFGIWKSPRAAKAAGAVDEGSQALARSGVALHNGDANERGRRAEFQRASRSGTKGCIHTVQ